MIENQDFEFVEDSGSSWGKNNGVTYTSLIMNQLSRITGIASCEMIEGHYKKVPMKTFGATMMQEIYIADKRKEYISAIQVLYDLMLPKFDDVMKEVDQEIKKRMIEKKKELKEQNKSETTWVNVEREFYREYFQQLNLLISRLGYFEEQGVTA